MLGKLMKYEFKASGRILLPLYVAVLALGLISGLFTRITSGNFDNISALQFITVLLIVLYCFIIAAGLILSFVISIIRFKKNIFDSEGYLMNTLPVKTSSNILAKLFVASIYQVAAVIVTGVSGIIFALMNLHLSDFAYADFSRVIYEIQQIMQQYGGAITLYGIEFLIFGIVALFSGNLMIYAAISIGHSSNSRKVLKSVCAYIGLYIVVEIINLNLIKLYSALHLGYNVDLSANIYSMQPFVLMLLALEIVYTVVYFAIANYFVKNKLNLE